MNAIRIRHSSATRCRVRLRFDPEAHDPTTAPEASTLADVTATMRGFQLVPRRTHNVAVLTRPTEEPNGAVLAFLADGEAWSSSALALALGASQRTVQRALDALEEAGKVQAFGHARARRWMTPPVPGFTTILLLPAPPPSDYATVMKTTTAEIIREFGPFSDIKRVHGQAPPPTNLGVKPVCRSNRELFQRA